MRLELSPELLTLISSALLAVLFDWFPPIRNWFDVLKPSMKRQVMAFAVVVAALLIFFLQCANFIFLPGYVCASSSANDFGYVVLLALGVNQGIHLLSKPDKSNDSVLSQSSFVGQGLVEYALILVLVAVVVIAALSVLGPVVGNVFTLINNSLNQ